jgi:hypothetical protein
LNASAIRVVVGYAVGFVAAQYWTVWLFRDALSGLGSAPLSSGLTARYFTISIIEAALAVGAFAFSLGLRARGRASRSLVSAVLGLLAGIVACSITVGAWPLIPRIAEGDAQLLLQTVAGAIISLIFGRAMSKFAREQDGQ